MSRGCGVIGMNASLWRKFRTGTFAGYAIALAATAAALLMRSLLEPFLHDYFPFTTFYVAALLLSMYVGFGSCLFASVLGWLAATYWIVPPRGSWAVQNLKAHLVASLVYAVVSMLTAVVGEMSRRSKAKL